MHYKRHCRGFISLFCKAIEQQKSPGKSIRMIIVCNPAVCVCNWALNEHTHTLLQDLTNFDIQQMRCLFLINTLLEIMQWSVAIVDFFSLSFSSKKVLSYVSFSLAGSHTSRQVGEGNVRITQMWQAKSPQWTSQLLKWGLMSFGWAVIDFLHGWPKGGRIYNEVWPSTVCYSLTAPWLWLSLKDISSH